MSPGGLTMESFFNRFIGRWSEKERKRKSSLQETNRNGVLEKGSAGATPYDPSDMTEPPDTKHNERCVDWPHDEDDSDDVTTRNAVNARYTKKEGSASDRKSSFSLFGGWQNRKSKEEETSGVLRRPKRFFSQQNLRAVSRDESVFEAPAVSTPRIATPKFLARLISNQKFRSSQHLPSVHEGFQTHDQGNVSNPRPTTSVLCSLSPSSSSSYIKSPLTDVRLGPEGMEGEGCFETEASSQDAGYPCFAEAARCNGDVRAQGKRPSWSSWQEGEEDVHINEPCHVSLLHQTAVTGHDLSPSGMFLGEYRPRLNTHQEEPIGAAYVDDALTGASGCPPTKRWSMQAPETFRGPLYGTSMDPRHASFEGSPQEQQVLPGFIGASTLDIENTKRPSRALDVDRGIESNVDRLWNDPVVKNYQRTDGEEFESVELRKKQIPSPTPVLSPQHFKSASYDNGDRRRSPDVRRIHAGDTLPSRFSPNQVQTLRQRSQELYSDYPLAQRRAISNADLFQTVWIEKRAGVDPRPAVIGRATVPDRNSSFLIAETFRPGVGTSQQGSDAGPFQRDSGHFRSLSMSQLQSNPNDHLQLGCGRHPNGFQQSPPTAHQRAPPNAAGFTGFSNNAQYSRCALQAESHHERGSSLDSSELGRSSFHSTVIRPCVEPRRNSTMVEDQTFSDPEIVGNFKRRSYDPSERPLRCRFSGRHGSGRGIDEAGARRVQQQQAVLSLFQKLTLAKQQKMYDTTSISSNGSIGCREPLSGCDHQQPETKEWMVGVQMEKNLPRQTLTGPSSRLSIDPELTLRSPVRVGYQKHPVTHERSSFNSYEDLRDDDLGSIDMSCIDESTSNAPLLRLDCPRRFDNNDRRSSDVKNGYSSTDLTNQRSVSPAHVRSQLTTNRPLVIELTSQGQMINQGQMTSQGQMNNQGKVTSQGQNGTVQRHSPPPPPLPPKSRRRQNYLLDGDREPAFDAEIFYADQLRQEARKLSLSSGSLRTGSSSKCDGIGETASEVSGDLEGCDAGDFHPHLLQQQQQQQQRDRRMKEDCADEERIVGCRLTDADSSAGSLKPGKYIKTESPSSSSFDQFRTQPDSRNRYVETEKTKGNDNYDFQINSAVGLCDIEGRKEQIEGRVLIESGRVHNKSGRVQNESGHTQNESVRVQNESGHAQNESARVQIESGPSQRLNYCLKREPPKTISTDDDSLTFAKETYPKHTGNESQPILLSTNDVTHSDQPTPGRDTVPVTKLQTPDTTNVFPFRLNDPVKKPSLLSSSEPAHSLMDFPDKDASASAEDDTFRGLASVLCRHLGSVDEELCSALRPPYVKACADFVRWIFENRMVLDLDLASRLEQPCRTSRTSDETPKYPKIPHSSLQTLKDELLTLVEKRLQRHLEIKQRLSNRRNETLLLEKKVTGIVREKSNSKQFEKFLSYLDQLEKVIQLLLNLTIRLSNVDKDLCDISDDSKEKQKKHLTDKRRQILERLKEAMELKWNIDESSQQVSALLSDRLTPQEFNEYREMVRSRCHVTLQSQMIEDRMELVLMQRRVLLARCHLQQSQTHPTEVTKVL